MKVYRGLAMVFFLLAVSLAACSPEAQPAPAVIEQPAEEPAATAADCPREQAGTSLLIHPALGFCFLYPEDFAVSRAGIVPAIALYTESPLNPESARATLSLEPADGRTLAEIAKQRLNDFGAPGNKSRSSTLGGKPAVIFDNLPGQDSNRRLITIHNDWVYDLMVAPVGHQAGPAGARAEVLYQMVRNSLKFINIEPNAPLQAGPECPEVEAGTQLFKNAAGGFCLLMPSEYNATVDPATDKHTLGTAFYAETAQDANHARLVIGVEDAGGHALHEISTALNGEIERSVPGNEVAWYFGLTLDGEPTDLFVQVPGPVVSRQLITVYNGRLYKLVFAPDDPDAGESYREMIALYDLVMNSFRFIRQ